MSDWQREDNSEWLWRISPRDDLLVERLSPRSETSDFAATEAERDWWLNQLAGYGAQPGDYVVERVPGPLRRAIADDRARRNRLVDAHWARCKAERDARLADEQSKR
ncbi:hypothetical protein L3Q65_46035 [Amycolatopsis sp. FU40]|uniref:hypothetical protein n=1 Tax=Amycolatopsis sp. FU40 TaxID=2914159 RepID=UPI001F398752|nr:hypothetical protein [Amycolatopsis sp. FU40]UKD55135.1 hypothetical protein L3Q65_46035 [Amycolatopsis sp. FU40]